MARLCRETYWSNGMDTGSDCHALAICSPLAIGTPCQAMPSQHARLLALCNIGGAHVLVHQLLPLGFSISCLLSSCTISANHKRWAFSVQFAFNETTRWSSGGLCTSYHQERSCTIPVSTFSYLIELQLRQVQPDEPNMQLACRGHQLPRLRSGKVYSNAPWKCSMLRLQ